MSFVARERTLRGRLEVSAAIDETFPLFSPEGERLWVPGWDPEILCPREGVWVEGQLFRTREEQGEAVWLITRLDRAHHHVEYHRVEPGRYVARVDVRCWATMDGDTEVSTSYEYVGLSESGNREIDAMTQEDYDAKMARWSEWIAKYLERA
jgi:hypothetical protein